MVVLSLHIGPAHISKHLRNKSPRNQSKQAKELNNAMAYFIMPFEAAVKPDFLKLIKTAVALYKVWSRKFLSKTEIPKMYMKIRANVQKLVAERMCELPVPTSVVAELFLFFQFFQFSLFPSFTEKKIPKYNCDLHFANFLKVLYDYALVITS